MSDESDEISEIACAIVQMMNDIYPWRWRQSVSERATAATTEELTCLCLGSFEHTT